MGAAESTAQGPGDGTVGGESPSCGTTLGAATSVGGSPRKAMTVASAGSPRGNSFPDFDADGFNLLCLSPPAGGGGSSGPASPSAWWKSKIA